MKRIISSLIVVLIVISAFAQQKEATISFNETTFDFGKIKEEGGSVRHKFEFTNTGNQPLVISHVKASCGCTTPSYSKAPVPPGGKGYIDVSYNPKNRPSIFNKSITITSNAEGSPHKIYIKGDVIPKPRTKADDYPAKLGDLRVKSTRVTFFKVKNTENKMKQLFVYNDGNTDITFDYKDLPSFVSAKAVPAALKPKEEGVIEISYNGSKRGEWGYVNDSFGLVVNGDKNKTHNIMLTADIVEDFSELTKKELENAPIIKVENVSYDFGTIKTGEKASFSYNIKNEGKRDLIIRKIHNTDENITVKSSTIKIKPGKTASIKVTFDASKKKGIQRKSISITSNDPKTPKLSLYVKGNIE